MTYKQAYIFNNTLKFTELFFNKHYSEFEKSYSGNTPLQAFDRMFMFGQTPNRKEKKQKKSKKIDLLVTGVTLEQDSDKGLEKKENVKWEQVKK